MAILVLNRFKVEHGSKECYLANRRVYKACFDPPSPCGLKLTKKMSMGLLCPIFYRRRQLELEDQAIIRIQSLYRQSSLNAGDLLLQDHVTALQITCPLRVLPVS